MRSQCRRFRRIAPAAAVHGRRLVVVVKRGARGFSPYYTVAGVLRIVLIRLLLGVSRRAFGVPPKALIPAAVSLIAARLRLPLPLGRCYCGLAEAAYDGIAAIPGILLLRRPQAQAPGRQSQSLEQQSVHHRRQQWLHSRK